jgi:hypothetical protein
MGCFSGRVDQVADTKIFARLAPPDRQVLIYELKLAGDNPVAMVLPVPTPTGAGDDAVRFVSLEGYPDLFDDLEKAFPLGLQRRAVTEGLSRSRPIDTLQVHEIGAFISSFVPSIDELDRIDPKFRISTALFEQIPEYAGWGYVVFQLSVHPDWLTRIPPMAFEFKTRNPDQLYFPLLHVDDGSVHPTTWYAHRLYMQGTSRESWDSTASLDGAVDLRRAAGLVLDAPAWRTAMNGERPNDHLWL